MISMLPYISVIIPSLNRPACLRQSLNSVLMQDTEERFEYEIIVVLDRRDKESEKWLEHEALLNKCLKVFRSDKNGVNSARNLGIKEARGEIIYCLDDDCSLPEKSQLANLRKNFEKYPDASAIGGGYVLENKGNDIFSISRNRLDNFYVEANICLTGAAGALLGGNTAYKKEIFIKYGCFDESMRYGSAETELNDRILRSAGKLYFIKELSVLHSGGKQNLSAYFVKSFMQGGGKAYSIAKNGRAGIMLNNKPRKIWFMDIAISLNVNFIRRSIAALFLFLNSLCYWAGLVLGKICCTIGAKNKENARPANCG